MTMTDSTGLDARTAATVGALPVVERAAPPVDHPGRWVGGLIGAAIPAVMAVVAILLGDEARVDIDRILAWDGVAAVSLAGIPVGFVVGRALFPMARSGGWRTVLGAALAAGVSAPPIGAAGVLFGQAIVDSLSRAEEPGTPLLYLVLLPYALVIGYVAAILTVPAGLAWAILARAVPAAWLPRLRMPAPIERLGVIPVVAGLVVLLLASELIRFLVERPA